MLPVLYLNNNNGMDTNDFLMLLLLLLLFFVCCCCCCFFCFMYLNIVKVRGYFSSKIENSLVDTILKLNTDYGANTLHVCTDQRDITLAKQTYCKSSLKYDNSLFIRSVILLSFSFTNTF